MVKHHGNQIKNFVNDKNINKDDNKELLVTFYADGTKTHSQEQNRNKNEINVAFGVNSDGEKVLLDVRVNESWEKTATEIEKQKILSKKACIIADA